MPGGPSTAGEWQKMIEFLRTTFVDHVRASPYEAAVARYLPVDTV
jgi:hypothetical protein